jgi:hypothetical protein
VLDTLRHSVSSDSVASIVLPDHCIIGTRGAELHPELALPPGALVATHFPPPSSTSGKSSHAVNYSENVHALEGLACHKRGA